MMAVERIVQLTHTSRNFSTPDDFDPGSLLEVAFNLIYDDPITVKIRFRADQARYIKERTWAKEQKITPQEDGSIVLDMKTSRVGINVA
jgi:hypothetical protein